MKRKKVLYLITKGQFGGAQRYVYDLARSLPPEEFEVAVAFGEGATLGQKLQELGIRTIHIKSLGRDVKFFKEIKSFIAIYKLLKTERPHVFHVNSSKGGIGTLIARIYNILAPRAYRLVPIFTAHGWAFNEDRSMFGKKIIKFFHWLTIIFSHTTIAVSEKTKKDIADLPFVRNKIKVIYNGIETHAPEQRSTLRHLLAPEIHEGVWIGTISELHKNKGLDFLIQAFAALTKKYTYITLVIIGVGGEQTLLENLVKKLGLEGRVHLLGFVPDAERVVNAFDIFTLTSRTEALPYTILEAGGAELPVVASKVGGIPEIITHKFNGVLVHPGNIEEIRQALQKLIDHPERRILFGKRLGQRIRKSFSLERMMQETMEVYEG